MKTTRRAAAGLALAVLGSGCWLLPEEYAFNAPVTHTIFGRGADAPAEATVHARIRPAAGFQASLYAYGIKNARFLRFTPAGDLLVSQPRKGQILLLHADGNGDGHPDGRQVLLDGLKRPHGMDLRDGWLYVGETDAVGRVRFDPEARSVSGEFERIVTGLPGGGNHWTRTVRFGPDGAMYVSVGSSCNACLEKDPRRAAMLRFAPDGSGEEIYATGLRNSVGFDWRPGTDELYATDNGRDLMGDDFPPCELNRIEPGGFYGWPYTNGDNVVDPNLGKGHEERIAAAIRPAHGFRAHTAPLGITFVRGDAAPGFRGAALVALHGSWNRTRKDGYQVVSLHWEPGGAIVEREFLVGFEQDEDVIGRPVDVAEGPDGAFYVSDDYAGAIYRVVWTGKTEAAVVAASKDATAMVAEPDADPARLARGHELYERLDCAACHDAGRAQPGVVPVELTGLATRYSVADLAAFLATPTPPMPAFDLDDGERNDLAAWLLKARR